MAASFPSLLCRLCYRFRVTQSLFSSNSRLFSAKSDGSENASSRTNTKDVDHSDGSNKSNINELNNLSDESKNDSKIKKHSHSATEQALDKFAKVIEKVKAAQEKEKPKTIPEPTKPLDLNESFASMLRKSHLVSLGDVTDRLVEGKVFEVMGDDLYIDFGGKFHCVCPRPKTNPDQYRRGTKVVLSLQCLEMSSAFLGSDVHVTLLEADATLLGMKFTRKTRLQSQAKS